MVELQRYQCVPEATGIAIVDLTTTQAKGQNLLYLMFGHRNTSLLCFRRGSLSISESSTTNLGFSDLINKMADKVSGLDKNRFINAIKTRAEIERDYLYNSRGQRTEIYTCKYEQATTSINWAALTGATKDSQSSSEIEQLKKAYLTSLDEHWALIANWLNGSLPPLTEIDYVVRSGGASQLFLEKLYRYFPKDLVYSPINYEDEIWSAFELHEPKNLSMASAFVKQNLFPRFVDVWRFFRFFSGYKTKKEAA